MKDVRILLVDDHQLIIDGLKSLLNDTEGIRVVSNSNNGKSAIELLEVLDVDVILMDIDMPIMNGLDAAKIIKQKHSSIKIIMLSMHSEKAMIKDLIQIGVDGYLLKNSSKEELINAIVKVSAGGQYFSSDVTLSLLIDDNSEIRGNSLKGVNLTNREIEIIKLIAEGYTNKEIGEKLFISHRTVDSHRTNLMKKLEVNNVAGLISYAIKRGIVS